MADDENLAPIGTRDIARFSISFDNLDEHLSQNSPSVEGTVEELSTLEDLQSYRTFSSIGDSLGKWRKYLLQEYSLTGPLGLTTITLREDDQEDINEAVQVLKTKYRDKLSELVTATPDTDLPVNKLRKGPIAFMQLEQSILSDYSDVRRDLHEACASLLIGVPTSSEFIALRSVEGILREWHSAEVDEERDYSGWYSAIEDMSEERYADGPKELSLLDYLRERRNEVAHPDRHSTIRDAERTLQNAFDIVEILILDIEGFEPN